MVLKNGHARKAAELFHNENETKIQQAHNIEKENRSLIESTESLATLTKYDVHHTFESENIRQKVSFRSFQQKNTILVQPISKVYRACFKEPRAGQDNILTPYPTLYDASHLAIHHLPSLFEPYWPNKLFQLSNSTRLIPENPIRKND